MTNFLSFFNKGAQVLQDSNYDVWKALPQMSESSLKTNIGFYIACTYWFAFLVFGSLAYTIDKKHLKGTKRVELLCEVTHSSSSPTAQSDEDIPNDTSVYPV